MWGIVISMKYTCFAFMALLIIEWDWSIPLAWAWRNNMDITMRRWDSVHGKSNSDRLRHSCLQRNCSLYHSPQWLADVHSVFLKQEEFLLCRKYKIIQEKRFDSDQLKNSVYHQSKWKIIRFQASLEKPQQHGHVFCCIIHCSALPQPIYNHRS